MAEYYRPAYRQAALILGTQTGHYRPCPVLWNHRVDECSFEVTVNSAGMTPARIACDVL